MILLLGTKPISAPNYVKDETFIALTYFLMIPTNTVGNKLDGSLPSELALLTDITTLVFFGESALVGSLPDSLQNLSQMTFFDASGSQLSGTIPSWIGQWSSLKLLSFTANRITSSLPTALASLTSLTALSIDSNAITGNLSVLESLTNLQSLYLEDNSFSGTINSDFLQNLSNLKNLDISGNNLAGQVPVHLMGLTTLQIMDLNGNQLTTFPDTIPATNGTISFLAVHNNPLVGTFPNTTILNLAQLSHLDLTSTQFTGDMPTELGALSQLNYLFMAATTFNNGSIPDEYQSLTNLMDLSLKYSRRTGVSGVAAQTKQKCYEPTLFWFLNCLSPNLISLFAFYELVTSKMVERS